MIEIVLAAVEFFLIIGASLGLSCLFLRKRLLPNSLDAIILRIILGFAGIIALTFFAGIFAFLNFTFFILLVAVGNALLIYFRKLIQLPGRFTGSSTLLIVLLVFAITNLFYSMFPPTFYDSMLYHLAVPSYYIQHGAIVPWVENFNANLPLNGEMMFTFSLLGKTVHVAKWISYFSSLLVIFLLFSWYKRGNFGKYALLPGLLFYTIPQVGFLASSAKTDILGMLFMLAGCRLFFYFRDQSGQKSLLWLSGICWGLAIGTKYIFAFFLLGFLLSLFFFKEISLRQRFTVILVVGICVFACLAPWLVKNTVITGNPVYPYLNKIFKSDSWSSQQGAEFSTTLKRGSSFNLIQYLYYPLEIFLKPYRYGITAVLGVFFLCCLPLIIFASGNSVNRILLISAGVAFVVLLFFARVPRYFLPAFLLMAIPIASGMERLVKRKKIAAAIGLPLLLGLLTINWIQQAHLQERFSKGFAYIVKKVSGKYDFKNFKYLYILPYFRVFEYMNRTLATDSRIIFLGEDRTFYLHKDFIASSFNDRNLVVQLLKQAADFDSFVENLKAKGISHMLYSEKGLTRLARLSSLYRLNRGEKERLTSYLNRFILLYQDFRYQVYKL